MDLKRCDKCGKQAESERHPHVIHPHGHAPKGWGFVRMEQQSSARLPPPPRPPYFGDPPTVGREGDDDAELEHRIVATSGVDLCPDCFGAFIDATGCAARIREELSAQPEMYPGYPPVLRARRQPPPAPKH